MARQIYITHFDRVKKIFDEVNDGISEMAIGNDEMRKQGAMFAQELARAINKRYVENLNNIDSEKLHHGESNIKISITDTKKGFMVHVSGKDVLYEEYGTGTRGLRHPHPRHDKDGMDPYGSGENVIRGTNEIYLKPDLLDLIYKTKKKREYGRWMYFNKNNGKRTPYWYPLYLDEPGRFPNDFNDEPIRATDYVWRHKGIITKGLPAGRFIFDSCEEFRPRGGLDKHSHLKQTFIQGIKKEFVDKINKTIHENHVVEKPEVRIKVNSVLDEYRRLDEMRRKAGL